MRANERASKRAAGDYELAASGARRHEAIPSQLGRYTILGRLASGGMATVYVGRQVGAAGFERIVAVKCCHEHLRGNAAFASMFLEEARLAARIRHPNVVATLDVSDGDPLYLIMEYVEGESLSALARRAAARGLRLPVDVSLRIMVDALAGLQAAHECRGSDGRLLGLVHCDVSPQNILVGVDGSARITDFGIARAAAQLPRDGGVIEGKLSYLAPEQLTQGPITPRSDIFSAGVVLWELLTGRTLFGGESDVAILRAALSQPVPPPSSLEPGVPRTLDAIVLRALQRDPARRFATAIEMLGAIEALSVPVATARGLGEYVRRELGTGALASQWESGAFRKGTAAASAGDAAAAVNEAPTRLLEASEPAHPSQHELPTRLVDAPLDLAAADGEPAAFERASGSTVPPPASSAPSAPAAGAGSAADVHRARRFIVALALVLLGCASGLLFATSSARGTGPAGVPPPPAVHPGGQP